jgi:HlyD family secretion protein
VKDEFLSILTGLWRRLSRWWRPAADGQPSQHRIGNTLLFAVAAIGIVIGISSAYLASRPTPAQPPAFQPAANRYAKGIYANGIVESDQTHGENINIYPEVSGPITQILVPPGRTVHEGDPLLTIDDTVQRATAEQQRAQADAASAMLEELKAEPRQENLAIAVAQVENARATLKNAQDQFAKQERSYKLDPRSVSLEALDSARDAAKIAATNLDVVQKQYTLTKAGAWIYDIQNQQQQYQALSKEYAASAALLAKYTIRAPVDGVVLSVNAAVGSYISAQGAYDSYTQGFDPVIVMGTPQARLEVRAYIDEVLVPRLPDPTKIDAEMIVQGTDVRVPLTFARVEPYVSPKIELSDQRQERVDVRVLPVIFTFEKPKNLNLYPGELVDVYIGEK